MSPVENSCTPHEPVPDPAAEAEALVRTGLAHFQHKQFHEAAEALARAVALRPTEGACIHLGLALGQTQRMEACRDVLVDAVRGFPFSPEVRAYLGTTLRTLGHLDEAIACYREALDLDPAHLGARWGLGLALGMAGRPLEGLVELHLALDQAPGFAPAHFHTAVLSLAAGNREAALRHWEILKELAPSYAERLGSILAPDPNS